jgi:PIN domain nuclease of toxin-antitoxin system
VLNHAQTGDSAHPRVRAGDQMLFSSASASEIAIKAGLGKIAVTASVTDALAD